MKKTNPYLWHNIVTFAIIFVFVLPAFLRGQKSGPPPPDYARDMCIGGRQSGLYSIEDLVPKNSWFHFSEHHESVKNQSYCDSSVQRFARRYSDIPVIQDSDSCLMHLIIPENLLNAELQILDSHGRIWTETKADTTKFNINIHSWPPGNYLVILSNRLRICQGNFTKL